MKRLILALALAVPLVAAAADDLNCSIKAKKLTSKKDMTAMAKVSDADARKTALDSAGKGASVVKGGLEVEDGCLIYDYDVKVAGKSGIEEITIDAGTGKVLKTQHEGAVAAGAAKVEQKAVQVKDKVKEEAKEVKDKVTK